MAIATLEAEVHHHVLAPGKSVVVEVIASTTDTGPGPLFTGPIATVTYNWERFVVLVRQGRPPVGFALKNIRRDATLVPKDAKGIEIALLPALGEKGLAIGFRLEPGWLVEVDIAIGKSKSPATLDELRAFITSLT